VLSVERVTAGAPAEGLLREGDLLLEVGGRRVASFRDVERASQAESVAVRLVRDGALHALDVPTRRLDGAGTERALLWGGALLQEPHRALASQYGIPPEGVYVSLYFAGSPAHHYGLQAPRRLLEVDGTPTPDLDAFRAAVARSQPGAFVRLVLADLDGRVEVITLRPDPLQWPTLELRRSASGWERSGPD
jgi:S1-C subfamily serine protease